MDFRDSINAIGKIRCIMITPLFLCLKYYRVNLFIICVGDYDNCAVVFANALFYVLQQQMDFGRGTIIEGLDNIIADFSKRHNKTAIYFTESYVLPEEFSKIEDHLKMYIAFFISEKELEFIHNYGCEEFENLLESSKADIINLNRESIV